MKKMIAMVAGLIVAGTAVGLADVGWNFEDGTTQGWYAGGEGSVGVLGSPGDYLLQNSGSGGPGSQSLLARVNTSFTVTGVLDVIKFDYKLVDVTPGLSGGLAIRIYSPSLPDGSAYKSLTDTSDWSRNNSILLSDFGLKPGDTISGVALGVFVVSPNAIYIDNVQLQSVSGLAAGNWTFEDGTLQGWYAGAEGIVSIGGNAGDYLLQNTGTGGPGSQSILPRVDTSYVVKSPLDTLQFDYYMFDITSGLVEGLSVRVYSPALPNGYSSLPLSYTSNWSRSNSKILSDFGLKTGDTVTGIAFFVFTVTPNALYLDNISLQPATLNPSQNGSFNVPAMGPITLDGNLSDWPASTDWSQAYIFWNGAGLSSTTKAKFAWNDATNMLYVAVTTDEASVQEGGHLVIGLGKDINAVPITGIGATQLCFDTWVDPVLGTPAVRVRNEIQYYTSRYNLGWGGGGVSGVQAAYSVSNGVYTYEIAIPLWADWRTMTDQLPLSVGDTVYVYSVMERSIESCIGTNLTYSGNPKFYLGAFSAAAALTLTAPQNHPGDANHDNKVDVSDLGILAANYGTTAGATWEKGDFNHDGKVDVSDLGILAANYGFGAGASLDFNADAKALGLSVDSDVQKTETPVVSTLGCGAAGLPLIAGVLLAAMVLLNWTAFKE